MNYKNEKDPDFIFAAQLAISALISFVDWADMVLGKSKDDSVYRYWMGYCTDFDSEKVQAQNYVGELNKSIDVLNDPGKSTPDQRYAARELISQCRSWNIAWDQGANQRDMIMDGNLDGDQVFPGERDWLPVVWPSTIAETMVPVDIIPGYDPFKDNQ